MAELNKPPGWMYLAGWLMLTALVVLSLIPLPAAPGQLPHSDKWLHLLTYAWLGYWFLHLYPKHSGRVLLGLSVLGVLLEGLQSLSPHRSTELADALMNATGVCLAWLIFTWLGLRLKFASGGEKRHD
jgi:VanZ family protein